MDNLYYKLTKNPLAKTVIDTNETIDYKRFNRFSELKILFNSIYSTSLEYNLPIGEIIFFINANIFKRLRYKAEHKTIKSKIKQIRRESINRKFNINIEFRFFNDFVLEKVRQDLIKNNDIILPDRFKSSYFFKSIDDCKRYYESLGGNYNCQIIKVKFIKTRELKKLDNYFLSNFQDSFTAINFYNQAQNFLLGEKSATPLLEIVFQGKYKILESYELND